MCEIIEKRIFEEKVYLATEALKKNELTFEQISNVLKIPLDLVIELSKNNDD